MSTTNIEQSKETYDVNDFIAAEMELQDLKEKYDIKDEKKEPLWKRIVDRYVSYKESRKPVTINKKKYCLTTVFLGWLGIHQFMVGKKVSGVLYMLFCWTGLSVALSALDLFYAAFLKADENQCITLS